MQNISQICGIKELPLTRYLEPLFLEISGRVTGEKDDYISCRINGVRQSADRLVQDFRWSVVSQLLPALSRHFYDAATMTHRQIRKMINKSFQ